MFKLKGNKCCLLSFEDDHLHNENYLKWLRDYDVIKSINRLEYLSPIPFERVKEYVETRRLDNNSIFLAIHTADNKFIGTIQIQRINWYSRIGEIGILIGDKNYWGRGIATEAIFLLSKYSFQTLGIRKLSANYLATNAGSGRAFEKVGYQQEGIHRKVSFFEGKYVDHIYLGCFEHELINL